jgi:hypothetical protein
MSLVVPTGSSFPLSVNTNVCGVTQLAFVIVMLILASAVLSLVVSGIVTLTGNWESVVVMLSAAAVCRNRADIISTPTEIRRSERDAPVAGKVAVEADVGEISDKVRNWAVWRWLKTFNLFLEYLQAAGRHWQEILGGVSVPFLLWGGWFIVGNPPAWINWIAVLLALLIAGYYTWRADHVRLMPKFVVEALHVQHTPNESGRSVWIQLEPRCLTDAPVEECQGRLLGVMHRYPVGSGIGSGNWETTDINEPLVLGWSHGGFFPITLEPGVGQRLNIFWLYSELPNPTVPQLCVGGTPLRAINVLTRQGSFRFHVHIRARNCPAVQVAVEYEPGSEWDKPHVSIMQGLESCKI